MVIKTPIKLKSGTKHFKPTTGMSYYDGLLENKKYTFENKGIKAYIRYMTPMKYIKEIVYGGYVTSDTTLSSYIKEKSYGKKVDKYVNDIKKGDNFPILMLEYSGNEVIEQEGAHRALAFQKLINDGYLSKNFELPVAVFLRKDKGWKGFFV